MNPQVDKYINAQVDWQRPVIKKVRELVHRVDPEITEVIKWGVPTFEHNGQVVVIMPATNWVALSYRFGSLLKVPKGTWTKDSEASKANRMLHLKKGHEVPEKLVIDLTKQAVTNNLAGKKVDFKIPRPGSREFDPPHEFEDLLRQNGHWDGYKQRPYYQQKGWWQWIEQAKTDATKNKRLKMMLRELETGQYMPDKKDRK